jgi:hypothetical protein
LAGTLAAKVVFGKTSGRHHPQGKTFTSEEMKMKKKRSVFQHCTKSLFETESQEETSPCPGKSVS